MTQFPVSTCNEQSIYGALELSKNSWLLAIQVRGRGAPPGLVRRLTPETARHR